MLDAPVNDDARARDHRILVDVEPGALLVKHLHRSSKRVGVEPSWYRI
jgi:hypothetical protein